MNNAFDVLREKYGYKWDEIAEGCPAFACKHWETFVHKHVYKKRALPRLIAVALLVPGTAEIPWDRAWWGSRWDGESHTIAVPFCLAALKPITPHSIIAP